MLAVLLACHGAWCSSRGSIQLAYGIGMAGKNRPSFWGLYITTFVFWIGISHAGTLISAILRVVQAEWRRPITRCAEAITMFALMHRRRCFRSSIWDARGCSTGWCRIPTAGICGRTSSRR